MNSPERANKCLERHQNSLERAHKCLERHQNCLERPQNSLEMGGAEVDHASDADSESPQPIQSRPKRVRKQFNVYSAGLDELEMVMVKGVACKKKRCN